MNILEVNNLNKILMGHKPTSGDIKIKNKKKLFIGDKKGEYIVS